jgi:hypothetical protein
MLRRLNTNLYYYLPKVIYFSYLNRVLIVLIRKTTSIPKIIKYCITAIKQRNFYVKEMDVRLEETKNRKKMTKN